MATSLQVVRPRRTAGAPGLERREHDSPRPAGRNGEVPPLPALLLTFAAMEDVRPGRFWWLKRLSAGVIIVLALWGGAHALLWRSASARLEARVDRWRADGGPLPEQAVVNAPAPTDPGNAATWVRQGWLLLPKLTQQQYDNWNNATVVYPLAGAQLEAMRSLVEQDKPAIAALRQAYGKPFDWHLPAVRFETLLPNLNEHRHLADRLKAAAEVHHHDGDIAEALRRVEDVLLVSESASHDGPALVTSLVAVGINAMATNLLMEHIIGAPVPGMSPEQEHAAWRAAAPEARRIIASLLEEEFEDRLVRNGVLGERTGIYWAHDTPSGWNLADSNLFTRPFLMDQLERVLEENQAVTDGVLDARRWSDLRTPPPPVMAVKPESAAELMASGVDGGYFTLDWRRPMASFWRIRAERRAAATLLAIRLYQADNNGALPATLEALVPEYLPAVPVDPFSPDGRPLRYLPGAPVPLVYSVGFDGIDGGGDWSRSPSPLYARENWPFLDVPFPLRWPADWAVFSPIFPATQPATSPASG